MFQPSVRFGRTRLVVVRDPASRPARRSLRRVRRALVAVATLVAVVWVLAHLVQVLLVVGLSAYLGRLFGVWR